MKVGQEKIQKVTSRGQITLPIAWRQKVKTDTIRLKIEGETIEISPVRLNECRLVDEYTVFDAKGKGLKASDLVNLLRKIGR